MDLFQQFSSFVMGGAQVATGPQAPLVHSPHSTPQSLLHSLPLGFDSVPAVYVNNHALAALPGEWSHDALLTPFHSFTAPSSISAELAKIRAAPFVGFDSAFFSSVVGPSASLEKIHSFSSPDNEHVHEAPIYLPLTNELIFADTSVVGWLWALDIDTAAIRKISTSPPLPNVNGGTSQCTTSDTCTLFLTTNGGTSPGIHACPLPANFSTTTDTLNCQPILNNYRSRHFNSPNDLILTPAGDGILFTDPDYGWAQQWPGVGPPEIPNGVYHFSLTTGAISVLTVGVVSMPNGLALSADGRTLYVADSGCLHGMPIKVDQTAVRGVWAFDIEKGKEAKALRGARAVHLVESGWPDGVRVSESGLLMVAVVGGVDVVDVERGVLLGKINIGDDVIYNLEPVKGRGKGEAVWLLTGKTGIYRAVISEKGLLA
jgi:sugar lactone lactonase YvrE